MINKKIYVVNTQSGRKEIFEPATNQVNMYVCGITPYDYAHIGHARCYISFDVIARLLLFWGYSLNYVRNITDIDDKIVKKVIDQCTAPDQLAAAVTECVSRYVTAFNEDMKALNVLTPTTEPTISGNIPAIIEFIQALIDDGFGYVVGSDVYFSREACASYGSLSGRTLEDLAAGARVDINELKKNPGDFVLWKGNVIGSLWDSPWGAGRPGWHIECSALAQRYCADTVDIHGGGIDLLFPHHENEKAQSESALGKPFARYWLHNAHVMLRSEKMSKSLGNVFFIRDILKSYDPMVVRFYILQHHYRTPLDIDLAHFDGAARAYTKLIRAFNPDALLPGQSEYVTLGGEWEALCRAEPAADAILSALADDCNIPKALGIIFSSLEELSATVERRECMRNLFQHVLGLTLQPLASAQAGEVSDEIQHLLALREQARAEKDWKRSDELRAELAARGYIVVDTKVSR